LKHLSNFEKKSNETLKLAASEIEVYFNKICYKKLKNSKGFSPVFITIIKTK